MAKKSIFNATKFLTSVATIKQLPKDEHNEVAFAGRSNAGKSSAINAITGINGLAKTSKTPGCTQLLNFFVIDSKRRLVDLPGYGYAKVPEDIKKRWAETLEYYFSERLSLRGLILVSDIRHPLNPFDQQILTWSKQALLPLHLLLTKADKLSTSAAKNTLRDIQKKLSDYPNEISVQIFSAKSGLGLDEARLKLLQLFKGESADSDLNKTL